MDAFDPEISDLIVDFDSRTLERRDVTRTAVLARLTDSRARRIAQRFGDGTLDRRAVDGVLVRSHLELQRLHEEFRVGHHLRALLAPLVAFVRARTTGPIRIVDVGCGLGYIVRWLASHGELGDHVELVGTDYNAALVGAAQRLAVEEQLACRFAVANAFELTEPAHIFMSTGVLHHFRGEALASLFARHEASAAHAFLHVDIRPSKIAPLGSWVFHRARMREPLAQFDGYWSTVRAHGAGTLRIAIRQSAPSFSLGMIDAAPGLRGLLRIFQGAVGMRAPSGELALAYVPLGRRFEAA